MTDPRSSGREPSWLQLDKDAPDTELLHRVSEVLFYLWGPIGVFGEPNARDEYDSYAPIVRGALLQDPTAEELARQLDELYRGQGPGSKAISMQAARVLVEWKGRLDGLG